MTELRFKQNFVYIKELCFYETTSSLRKNFVFMKELCFTKKPMSFFMRGKNIVLKKTRKDFFFSLRKVNLHQKNLAELQIYE